MGRGNQRSWASVSTEKEVVSNLLCRRALVRRQGELAQMVERSLSMREVAGSMPAFSSGLDCVRLPFHHDTRHLLRQRLAWGSLYYFEEKWLFGIDDFLTMANAKRLRPTWGSNPAACRDAVSSRQKRRTRQTANLLSACRSNVETLSLSTTLRSLCGAIG